jgi:hypothetical protein
MEVPPPASGDGHDLVSLALKRLRCGQGNHPHSGGCFFPYCELNLTSVSSSSILIKVWRVVSSAPVLPLFN